MKNNNIDTTMMDAYYTISENNVGFIGLPAAWEYFKNIAHSQASSKDKNDIKRNLKVAR